MTHRKDLGIAVIYGYSDWDLDISNSTFPNDDIPLPAGWALQSFGALALVEYPNGGFVQYDPVALDQLETEKLVRETERLQRNITRTVNAVGKV